MLPNPADCTDLPNFARFGIGIGFGIGMEKGIGKTTVYFVDYVDRIHMPWSTR